ncbi:MAG: polysaccharide deacetylase family protein [Desulfitobacteriaceae bacterium]
MLFLKSRYSIVVAGILLLAAGILSQRLMTALAIVPPPLEQVKTEQRVIGLTVNVDWGEEYIPGILAGLEKHQAKATFFLTGRWAKKNPDLIRQIIEHGHQVENHGYSHPHPDRLSVGVNQEEIKKTESIIQGIIGRKTRYYAPPYGERGSSGLTAAYELGYRTVLWTLDTVDWRPESTPEVIAARILRPPVRFGIKPDKRGALVLMHPTENTVKALPIILAQLSKEGYKFLTLDELITLDKVGNTTS